MYLIQLGEFLFEEAIINMYFSFREMTLQIVSRGFTRSSDILLSSYLLFVYFLIYFFVYLEVGERFKLKFGLCFHFQIMIWGRP